MTTKKDTSAFEISFFAALCLFLSAVEYAIPKPVPFLRLGLANVPVLLAIKKMKWRDVLLLVLLKILGQAFISGTLFSYIFLFSATGSFTSGLVMLLVYHAFGNEKKSTELQNHDNKGVLVSDIGISLAGALGNNAAQLLCARFVMFGDNTKYIAPILLISGTITGLLLGVFTSLFELQSVWFKTEFTGTDLRVKMPMHSSIVTENQTVTIKSNTDIIWFICSLCAMVCFLFIKNLYILWIAVLIFYICTVIRRHGKVKVLPSILIVLSVTFFALLSPYGKVLFTIGSWRITAGALMSGLHRSGILVGMVFLSQCAVSRNLKLPGTVGEFIASMFTIFEMLTEKRISFKPGKIISSIDERLLEIWKTLCTTNISGNTK